MAGRTGEVAMLAVALAGSSAAVAVPSTTATTTYHRVQVQNVAIFYREAGSKDAPAIVLLQGFPSFSNRYATLIPLPATRCHVTALDFLGFGQSDASSPAEYDYTFDHLAQTISAPIEQLSINQYTLYPFDHVAPVGYRTFLARPERLHALIVQNGNVHKKGLGPKWARIAEFWADPKAHPEVVDVFMSYEATKQRHLAGTSNPDVYDPESWNEESLISHDLASTRSKRPCSTATAPLSHPILPGRIGCARTSHRRWSCGAQMIPPSSPQVRRLIAPTGRMQRSTSWTPATSRWRSRKTRSAACSSTS